MKTIDDILKDNDLNSAEKAVFLDILKQAKTFQKTMTLDQLKSYMNQQIDKLIDTYED